MPASDVLSHVGTNIKRFRDRRGLSQQMLADEAGVSRRTIAGLETGSSNISLAKLSLLASVLEVDFTTLVKAPDRPEGDVSDVVAWRGAKPQSHARLHACASASRQVELWTWVLAPGERYQAEADPPGWQEMLYIVSGELTLELASEHKHLKAGESHVFDSSTQYAYSNRHDTELIFVRNVVN